jgi:hypothetical protein
MPTIGYFILIFGLSVILFTASLFSYIDNEYIPLSPIFIIPVVVCIIGVVVVYIGEKYHD